jgi:DHA1 family bicyclomycin/chloramphenicol resistance-like MFS transporter
MLAGRVLQGAGGCAGIVLGRAIIRDGYDRERAAAMMGYVAMGFAVAPLIGPAIGGFVDDHFGWRASFGLLCALGGLATIAAFIYLPETNRAAAPEQKRAGLLESFAVLIKVPAFLAYASASALATAVFFAFLGGTPFVASSILKLSGTEYGAYFGLAAFGYLIGNFLTARFTARFGIARVIIIGGFVGFAAAVLMAVAFAFGHITTFTLFAPIFIVGISNGLILPNAIAGGVSVRPDLAGAAAGLSGSLQIGVGAIATVVIGWAVAATESAFLLSVLMAVFAALGLAACLWTRTARQ